jgi:class 3 adenylate cyclase
MNDPDTPAAGGAKVAPGHPRPDPSSIFELACGPAHQAKEWTGGGRMPEWPTGTVSLLFTDIEGSTRLLQRLGDRYGDALAQHRRLVREAITSYRGQEVDNQGDAIFAAFRTARDAVAAAVAAQRSLARHAWPEDVPLRVRMGIHSGEPTATVEGYVGIDLHRAARICAAAHGGQILVSQTTRELVGVDLPSETVLRDLGEHRLKDLAEPQGCSRWSWRTCRPTSRPSAAWIIGRPTCRRS